MQHYIFYNNNLLLTSDNRIPESFVGEKSVVRFCLNDNVECIAAYADVLPDGFKVVTLRNSYDILCESDYLRAGKAAELLYWHETHKYCSKCGAELSWASEISKFCPNCQKTIWPKLSPAIIVLVHDDNRILLVKSKDFKGTFFGLVAGFVEFGESIEEAVVREVREETQLEIKDLKYFGSQPWPYPLGLMLGFIAKYKSGTIKLQTSELVAGEWFDINNLPEIPKPLSMARRLIDYFVNSQKNANI